MQQIIKIFLFVSLLIITSCQDKKTYLQKTEDQKLTEFFQKKEITILVTDSGLGGLSVAAELENRIKDKAVFKKINIIFFNAQPKPKSGYNSMKTTEEKIRVFNNALFAMNKKLKPDMLLIACNTLSVLYDQTPFSKEADFPVVGVVNAGVNLIEDTLKETTDSQVIIFATETTIGQETHKKKLLQLGVSNNQIITQACPNLAGRIERNPNSNRTKELVKKYVEEAVQKIQTEENALLVSYNCTHYPYIDNLFKEEFESHNISVADFLNPNPLMIDFIFDKNYVNRYQNTNVSVEIISQIELSPDKIEAISKLIKPTSKTTSEVLKNYEYTPNFFKI